MMQQLPLSYNQLISEQLREVSLLNVEIRVLSFSLVRPAISSLRRSKNSKDLSHVSRKLIPSSEKSTQKNLKEEEVCLN